MTTNETLGSVITSGKADEVKALLRAMIRELLPFEHELWTEIVEAAKESPLVSWTGKRESDHPNARKMARVAPSQILDRMNIPALAFTYMKVDGGSACDLARVFRHGTSNGESWPWAGDVSKLIDHALVVTDVASRARAAMAKGGDTGASAPPSPTPTATWSNPYAEIELDHSLVKIIDSLVARASGGGIATFGEVLGQLSDAEQAVARAAAEAEAARRKAAATPAVIAQPVAPSGDIPAGKPVRMHAGQTFGMQGEPLLDFEVAGYEWEDANPLVPAIDPHHEFDAGALAALLFAQEHNLNAWLVGHTGTGKTTLVEQAMARLGRMVTRVNFDSEITRMEFVGKVDVRTDDHGNPETVFSDGILPKAMGMPVTMLLDEADAIRGDISYILQPVLEGGNLRLLEDGGRIVARHPDFRVVATANSAGAGDTSGLYSAGVKVQSAAAMNRYQLFVPVDYMPADKEIDVALAKTGAAISPDMRSAIGNFLVMYRKAFTGGEVTTPISPRNTTTLVRYAGFYEGGLGSRQAFENAVRLVMENRLDEGDAAVVRGIVDRTTNL